MKTIKASEIYKDILEYQNYKQDSDAAESVKRTLRNKMNFLLEQVALRKVSEFKRGNAIHIPICDAAIVRNLLLCSIQPKGLVVDWFNGSLDLSEAFNCIMLYREIKVPIMRAEIMGETDSVTVDEWLANIRGLINYDMARSTLDLKQKLENFRVNTLVRNSTVRYGDICFQDENGYRDYALERKERNVELSTEILEQITKNLSIQSDYFTVLNQIMEYMIEDAEKKSIPDIETYALAKKLSECDTAYEMIRDNDGSMISEYSPWFQKIAKYLKTHPDVVSQIEKETETENLQDFFEIK